MDETKESYIKKGLVAIVVLSIVIGYAGYRMGYGETTCFKVDPLNSLTIIRDANTTGIIMASANSDYSFARLVTEMNKTVLAPYNKIIVFRCTAVTPDGTCAKQDKITDLNFPDSSICTTENTMIRSKSDYTIWETPTGFATTNPFVKSSN